MIKQNKKVSREEFEEMLEPHLSAPKMKVVFGELFNHALQAERKRLVEEVNWILTPHGFESDDPIMEKFALKLKEKLRKKVNSLTQNESGN